MNDSSAELSVSVIVPVYNGGDKFPQCLGSLKETSPPPDDICVVADEDTDGSFELAHAPGFHALRLACCGGPAHARNFGARRTQTEILFFIDADVTVRRDAVDQVKTTFRGEPYLAAVFGSYDARWCKLTF